MNPRAGASKGASYKPPVCESQWLSGSCPAVPEPAIPNTEPAFIGALIWPSLPLSGPHSAAVTAHHAVRRHKGTNNVDVSPLLLTNAGGTRPGQNGCWLTGEI